MKSYKNSEGDYIAITDTDIVTQTHDCILVGTGVGQNKIQETSVFITEEIWTECSFKEFLLQLESVKLLLEEKIKRL